MTENSTQASLLSFVDPSSTNHEPMREIQNVAADTFQISIEIKDEID